MKKEIESLPKIETHLHLDGTLTPDLVKRLAQEQGYRPLAEKSLEEIASLAVVQSPRPSLQDVLNVFRVAIDPLIGSASALETIAYEFCRRAREQNIVYFETRFAPTLCLSKGLSAEEAVEAAWRGLERGKTDFNVESRIIICLLRDLPEKTNRLALDAALKLKGKVAALDLANDELAVPLARYADFFKEAKRGGLSTTVHCGEVYPSPDFQTVLDLGIDRIGHGTHLIHYPDLMQETAKRKIPIEINLTSNWCTGAVRAVSEHPAKIYHEKGIPLLISTDDPGVFGIDLNHEYEIAERDAGFSFEDLRSISRSSWKHVFLPEAERLRLKQRLEA